MSTSFHTEPGRLQVREGGGCLSLFGSPFLAAGIFMILVALRVIPMQNTGAVGTFAWPALFAMGVVFSAVGGVLVFGRSWTTVDAMQRTVLKQWGLVVPMGAKSYPLDGYCLVRLEFRRGDSDSADQFPVSLKSRTGRDLQLFSSTEYAQSRERAAAVADLLHFDIEDVSTDHAVRIAPGTANVALQHRLRVEPQQEERVARPVSLRSEITERNGETRIAIPLRRYHPASHDEGASSRPYRPQESVSRSVEPGGRERSQPFPPRKSSTSTTARRIRRSRRLESRWIRSQSAREPNV